MDKEELENKFYRFVVDYLVDEITKTFGSHTIYEIDNMIYVDGVSTDIKVIESVDGVSYDYVTEVVFESLCEKIEDYLVKL